MLVAEKLEQSEREADADTIKKKIGSKLKEVCRLLPNESDEGKEFVTVMFKFVPPVPSKGKDTFNNTIEALVAKCMDARDDLCDYPHIRQKLVDAINQ